MTQLLVYRGWGDAGLGAYGHVVGTDFTYEITGMDPNFVGTSNWFSQAGEGFVFRGTNTNGSEDGLVYSNGFGHSVILNDENSNLIQEPTAFSQFGNQTVFLASTASVSATFPVKSLMITDGNGAPKVLLPEPVEYYTYAANSLWARTSDGDLYRIEQNGSSTQIYDDSAVGNNLDIDFIFEFNGALYMRGDESSDNDFYRVDPISGAITKLNIAENGGGDSINFWFSGVADSQFFFWWNDGAGAGTELYSTDGTSDGTGLVKDIRPGSISSYEGSNTTPNTVGDLLFFVADDGGVDDEELWVSDGTGAGTFALSGSSTNVGSLSLNSMESTALGNELLFTANSGSGEELFITDGTIAGTRLLAEINPAPSPFPESSSPTFWTQADGLVYFSIKSGPDEEAIWVTNGTTAGTFVISDPDSGNGFNEALIANILDVPFANIPVREVIGSSGNDTIAGTFLRDRLLGNDGDDTISGDDANDILEGGNGNDMLDGGADIDTASYANASSGVDVYLQFTGRDTGGAGVDTLISIENLTGSAFNDRLVGDGGNNALAGGAGADVIKGKGGNDTFNGDAGDDRLIGGAGNDIMFGGAGNDTLIALGGLDTLNGGDDNDFLFGGKDNDTLNGDGGIDNIRGNLGVDVLSGGTGNDTLRGGGQNDTLNGDADDDFLFGENHSDILFGGAGNDSLTGGAGGGIFDNFSDTFIYKNTADGGGGFDRVKDFEDGIDIVDLTSFGFANFATNVTPLSSQVGSGVRVDFGSGDVLFIENMLLADWDAGDVLI